MCSNTRPQSKIYSKVEQYNSSITHLLYKQSNRVIAGDNSYNPQSLSQKYKTRFSHRQKLAVIQKGQLNNTSLPVRLTPALILPCTSITVKAPRVTRCPVSNFPRTNSTIWSIWAFKSCRYFCQNKTKLWNICWFPQLTHFSRSCST